MVLIKIKITLRSFLFNFLLLFLISIDYRRDHLGESSFEHSCGVCHKKFYRTDMLRLHQVKFGHYTRNSLLDNSSTSTQIIVVETTSEIPLAAERLEVLEDDEEIETETTETEIIESSHDLETQEIETQEIDQVGMIVTEVSEANLDTELSIFINSMNLPGSVTL